MRKPRVLTKCVANAYAGPNERIVEFSDGKGNGGLVSLMKAEDGRLLVHVYNFDGPQGVAVSVAGSKLRVDTPRFPDTNLIRVGQPQPQPNTWERAAIPPSGFAR